jgi:hypothetical protein
LALGFGEYRHIQDDPDPDVESLRDTPKLQHLVTAQLQQTRAALTMITPRR